MAKKNFFDWSAEKVPGLLYFVLVGVAIPPLGGVMLVVLVLMYLGSEYAAFENDRIRDQNLMLEGYRTVRFSANQVYTDPRKVIGTIRSLAMNV